MYTWYADRSAAWQARWMLVSIMLQGFLTVVLFMGYPAYVLSFHLVHTAAGQATASGSLALGTANLVLAPARVLSWVLGLDLTNHTERFPSQQTNTGASFASSVPAAQQFLRGKLPDTGTGFSEEAFWSWLGLVCFLGVVEFAMMRIKVIVWRKTCSRATLECSENERRKKS
eukprot:TRINITY_DN55617_c0_g1_i1.p2 TRINITY_DN55617_c0_g1~~TRINITY_DN55617_c0_g1_i1.p2  ORF type:complete len:172 (-),score=20.52 TRINITY_DN55617_c0_g1_i1:145-660(-)